MKRFGLAAAVSAAVVLGAGTAQAAAAASRAAQPAAHTGAVTASAAPTRRIALGGEVTPADLGNSSRMGLVDSDFNSITPNVAFKWPATESLPGSMTLGSAENFVTTAKSAGLSVRAGAIVWDHANHYPSYLTTDYQNGGSDAIAADLEEHITNVMTEFSPGGGAYAGVVSAWDVVNEPLAYSSTPSMATGQVFDQALGSTGYIAAAFQDAHAVDPTATLCLNEDGVTGMSSRSTYFYNLVTKLLGQGVPITCVGFETHVSLSAVLSGADTQSKITQNFARFAALKTPSGQPLTLQITELDVRLADNGVTPVSSSLLKQQAQAYTAVTNGCLSVAACTSMTTWGVDDGNSWVPAQFHDCPLPKSMQVSSGQVCGSALMFDKNYQPKPAYTAVLQALGVTP